MNMRTELRKIVCFILLIPTLYRVLQTFFSKVYMIPCRNFMLRVPPALAARVGSRNLGPVLLRSFVEGRVGWLCAIWMKSRNKEKRGSGPIHLP